MTHLLVDTSVLIKWFHQAGESELQEARAIRDAHISGEVDAHIIDLAIYEIGNVLGKALRWDATRLADQLDDVQTIIGPPILIDQILWRHAAQLADRHSLTFYDACWAAAADRLQMTLVSADRQLLAADLAESPASVANRLRLRHP